MMNELNGLIGGVGTVLTFFGLIAGVAISNRWVLVIMVVGLALLGIAYWSEELLEHRAQAKRAYPVYKYNR
jgi:hypothetical protein